MRAPIVTSVLVCVMILQHIRSGHIQYVGCAIDCHDQTVTWGDSKMYFSIAGLKNDNMPCKFGGSLRHCYLVDFDARENAAFLNLFMS